MNRTLLTIAGTLGFSAVLLGAFGAHGLRDKVAPPMLEIYRTGVLYHLVHAVVVLAVAFAADRLRRPRLVAGLFTARDRDLLRHAVPAGDHGVMRLGRHDADRRRAADGRLGRADRRGLPPIYLSSFQSAAEITTSMQVTRPRPASSLR